MFCSVSLFARYVLLLLLLLLYGGSISLAILPIVGGSVILFQVFQLIAAAVPFLVALLTLCYIIIHADAEDYDRERSPKFEIICFLIMTLTSIAASVLITLRFIAHQLKNDYFKVHDSPLLALLVVIVSWTSAAIACAGCLLVLHELLSKRRVKDNIRPLRSDASKPIRHHPKVRPGSLPIQTPPPTERRSFMHPPITTYTRSNPYEIS